MLGQQLVNGVVVGLIYGLLALGFSLAFSTTRIVNFAHGDMFSLGAFIGLTFQRRLEIPFAVAAAASVLIVFALAGVFCYVILWRLRGPFERSVATIALGLLLRDAMLLGFGSDSSSFLPVYPNHSIVLSGLIIPWSSIIIALLTGGMLLVFGTVVSRTRWGIWMRATAQNEELAALAGIRTRRVHAFAFGVGAAVAAAAGVLICPVWQVNHLVGTVVGLKAFTAALLGGLGQLSGAVIGGLILGILEALLAGYISSLWKDFIVYTVLLMVLVFLPRGVCQLRPARVG